MEDTYCLRSSYGTGEFGGPCGFGGLGLTVIIKTLVTLGSVVASNQTGWADGTGWPWDINVSNKFLMYIFMNCVCVYAINFMDITCGLYLYTEIINVILKYVTMMGHSDIIPVLDGVV